MTDNPYASPASDPSLQFGHREDSSSLIDELSHQSTWRLVGLSLITCGIYNAHYIHRQSMVINKHVPLGYKISPRMVTAIFIISYLAGLLTIPYMLVDDGHWLESLSNIADLIWTIALILWGFEARKRTHKLIGSLKGGVNWFSGLWTFVFSDLYFNYKVNQLKEHALHAPKQTNNYP